MHDKIFCPVCGARLADGVGAEFSTKVGMTEDKKYMTIPTLFIKCYKCKAEIGVWSREKLNNTGPKQ